MCQILTKGVDGRLIETGSSTLAIVPALGQVQGEVALAKTGGVSVGLLLDRQAASPRSRAPSAGNCSAGEPYRDASDHDQAFITSEVNGTCGTAQEVPGPRPFNSGGSAVINSVSHTCPGPSMRTLGGEVVGGRWGRSPVRRELVGGVHRRLRCCTPVLYGARRSGQAGGNSGTLLTRRPGAAVRRDA